MSRFSDRPDPKSLHSDHSTRKMVEKPMEGLDKKSLIKSDNLDSIRDIPRGTRAVRFRVNQRDYDLVINTRVSLLHVLRNDLGLNGPKYGCGYGQCGACTVHVDGIAARACVIPAVGVTERNITTLEGLGSKENWHPVQAAFETAQAAQCGYCLNGMVMQVAALLERDPDPTDARVRAELSGNLCRCGTHGEILQAVAIAVASIKKRGEVGG